MKEKKEENKRVAAMTRTEKLKAKDKKIDEKGEGDAGLDLFEPSDILSKYGEEWQDNFANLKKWEERKKEFE